ncbi:rhodanese-like domain-containing protein [Salinimicrobium flavum]|uniref:Rhodanese-like domain-containing protein n=1 Tax=Salinimicrobium flavum TaxID=1737065 RepID=A0ABW5IY43_9FLAO
MKKFHLYFIAFLLLPALSLTSCDRGDELEDSNVVTTPAFELMTDYMVQNGLDINNVLTNKDGQSFVVGAPAEADLAAFLNTYYIMDIRSSADFLTAHINGAQNVAFKDILTTAATTTKPILIVCYTGQTACYATALLRLYGYPNTRALKWGMSGWNAGHAGPWNSNINDIAKNSPNWTYGSAPANVTYGDPKISTTLTNGEAILKERVEKVVAEGFQGVNPGDVLNNPGGYFINNYFSEADYSGFGHISSAYRIQPLTLADDSYKSLDPLANTIVTYCYTGQTSAVLTATLRVLGYNAASLKFGMNGLYNSNPAFKSNQWQGDSHPKNLPVVSN